MKEQNRARYAKLKREFMRYPGSLTQFAKDHAEELGVSWKAIQTHGCDHHWIAERKKYLDKVDRKTLDKLADRDAEKQITALELQGMISEELTKQLYQVMTDPEQFFRHLIQSTHGEVTDTDERVFKKFDSKSFKETVQGLKDLVSITRNVNELPTLAEQQAQADREARLQLDREKLDKANADGTAVIHLLFEDPEAEKMVSNSDIEDEPREYNVIEVENGERAGDEWIEVEDEDE